MVIFASLKHSCLMTLRIPGSWILEPLSIYVFLCRFKKTRNLSDGNFTLRIGMRQLVSAEAILDFYLYFHEFRVLMLKDCYYVLGFKRNLVYVSCLFKDSC